MEAIGDIQETYNIWSWLLPLISGAIGALWGVLFLALEAREEN